jgi:uncharacterized protein YndB with AHSA1/START domain
MPEKNSSTIFTPVEREVVMVREFNAPRSLVFEAWTDPRHVSQWWGPERFTNPRCEMDVRPGGAWQIVMRGLDGSEYPCQGIYKEIVPNEKLAFTNNAIDRNGNVILEGFTTVTFEDRDGKTIQTLRTRAVGLVEGTDRMLAGMEQGWSGSQDKLERLVASQSTAIGKTSITRPSDRELAFTRIFDAPRDLVFEVWTEPRHLAEWYGPNGFHTETVSMDLRPGGIWRLVMHGPDRDYHNRIVYLEVVRPERIVYKHAPEAGDEQSSHQATVTFEDLGKQTRLTLNLLFETAEAREEIVRKYGAEKGGVQTLARLADYVERAR